jgi:hypothetical protein
LVKEALDEVALATECEGGRKLVLPIGLGRDYRCDSVGFEVFDQGVGIVSLAGDQSVGFDLLEQGYACVMSAACPGVSQSARGLPSASTTAWILVVSPPRERPMAGV